MKVNANRNMHTHIHKYMTGIKDFMCFRPLYISHYSSSQVLSVVLNLKSCANYVAISDL